MPMAKMDLRLFPAARRLCFSRNPKIGMGPPKFKSASIQLLAAAQDAHYAVRMKYTPVSGGY